MDPVQGWPRNARLFLGRLWGLWGRRAGRARAGLLLSLSLEHLQNLLRRLRSRVGLTWVGLLLLVLPNGAVRVGRLGLIVGVVVDGIRIVVLAIVLGIRRLPIHGLSWHLGNLLPIEGLGRTTVWRHRSHGTLEPIRGGLVISRLISQRGLRQKYHARNSRGIGA